MGLMSLKVTQTTYYSLLTHAKELSLMTFYDTTSGSRKNGKVMDGFCVDKCESDPKIKRIR